MSNVAKPIATANARDHHRLAGEAHGRDDGVVNADVHSADLRSEAVHDE